MTRINLRAADLQPFFGSAHLASALATASVGVGVFAWALHRVVGWAGLMAILSVLILLCFASVSARRDSIEWTGLVPISLLIFVCWATGSIFWSQYQWATAGGLAYLASFTILGLYVALVRDMVQIIRIFGDVLRLLLVLSLALEVFSGLLIDMPINFVAIAGHLDSGGPISGLLGNRNELGLFAVIAGVSFAIEWRTRAVSNGFAIGSLALGFITLVLTQSPIAWGTFVVALVAMVVLYGLRRLPSTRGSLWQFITLGVAVLVTVIVWLFRTPIVSALNAGGELNYRLRLWQQVWSLVPQHSVEGWGWVGQWNTEIFPFSQLGASGVRGSSAANAFLDVWFQLGIIGLAALLLLIGLAFVRSWLLAARQRSVIFTWPAVVLATLITASLAESGVLIEFGWLTFVVCCVKASQKLSWRTAFQRPLEPEPLS